MKKYFELIETVKMPSPEDPQPQLIRLEIAKDSDADALLAKYETEFSGKTYKAQIHDHYHAEGQPCETTVIKEVTKIAAVKK